MTAAPALLEITRLAKRIGGPRPLRIERLVVRRGERVALTGVDPPAAETLVGLVTGAAVPEEGEVRLFGRSTADIRNAGEWFAMLDRLGLVSPRAVFVPGSTVLENLAVPYTLSIDPLAGDVARQAEALAREAGIEPAWLSARVEAAPPAVAERIHLGRALALDPELLVLEHPAAALPPGGVKRFAREVARIARRRGLAVLAITNDRGLAWAVAERVVSLDPATGAVVDRRPRWRRLRAFVSLGRWP